jgi:outer membrane protein insertion porin family
MRCTICFAFLAVVLSMNTARGQEINRRKITLYFEGNTILSKELPEVANKCVTERAQVSDRYDSSTLDYCLRKVTSLLKDKGYLQAKVGRLRKWETEDEIRIAVPIEEGSLYRIGEIRIQGPQVFSPAQLRGMSDLKAGDVAAGETISLWLEQRVKCAYADHGYIQYSFSATPIFRPVTQEGKDGLVDFEVEISEGKQFTIRRIVLEGNKHTPEEILRRALLINEGAVFSEHLYVESIGNLNRLGIFEEIDATKDMDMRSVNPDNKQPQIDLIIHLKEKPR